MLLYEKIVLLMMVLLASSCQSSGDGTTLKPEETLARYFLEFSEQVDLDVEAERILTAYDSAIVYHRLPSTNSLLLSLDKDDFDAFEINETGITLSAYFNYNETSDFFEIVKWSRRFVTEEDFAIIRQHIDNIYFTTVGDDLFFSFLNHTYSGKIQTYTTESDTVFVAAGENGIGLSNLTVFFAPSFTEAKITFVESRVQYRYQYDDQTGLGYFMPSIDYKYLVGALGSE